MLSSFRETLEATGNGTLHFSCQTQAGLMAYSQRVAKQKDGPVEARRERSVDHVAGHLHDILLPARPPELLELLKVSQQQINASSFRGVDSEYRGAEIWSQLNTNYGETQMFLLFFPLHILLPHPSLLPSLPVPSIWQKTWMYPQLMMQTPINHPPSNYTTYLALISKGGTFSI